MDFPENVGERRFAQFAVQGRAGRAKDFVQLGLDALTNRALGIRLRSRHHERLIRFNRAEDAGQRNVAWWLREAGAEARAAASFY
jgi:hypothetical protein